VELRHHHFCRRLSFLLHFVDRNAAAVIDHGDRVIEMDRHLNRVAIAGQGFVDRVIDNLVYQVMKT
jgi:hypothetical protein